jgi:hypothetical protein
LNPERERTEVAFEGGDMIAVVRVGDTRTPCGGAVDADDPRVHAPPAASGVIAVPEPRGLDEKGREVISLLRGAPATIPPSRPATSSTRRSPRWTS